VSATVRFLGSGDSFGSGGRLQTCILVDGMGCRFLLDCGASCLVGMRLQGVDPNSIDLVVISHLHGDHCGGVAFLLMDAMLGSKRQRPLTIAGPPGMKAHLAALQEVLFPGSYVMAPRFSVRYVELRPGEGQLVNDVSTTSYEALHTPETNPLILRVAGHGKVVVYTGDTAWTDALIAACDDADLLISECYYYEKPIPKHMNYLTFKRHRKELKAKAIVLTHMSIDMLDHADQVPERCAYDGMVLDI
jgi:ribonuclease BN (tRNA processing enzyme)